jgi:hypothetical protein
VSSAVTGNAPHAAGRVAHARNCGLSLLDGGDVRDQQSPGTNVEQLLELHAVVPRRPDDRSRVLAAVQRQQLIKYVLRTRGRVLCIQQHPLRPGEGNGEDGPRDETGRAVLQHNVLL